MAQRVIMAMTDDLTGEEFDDDQGQTFFYAVQGTQYEIDLTTANVKEFEQLLAPYIAVSRKSKGNAAPKYSGSKAAKASTSDKGYDVAELREWAAANGIEVAARGRIKQSTVDEFLASKK